MRQLLFPLLLSSLLLLTGCSLPQVKAEARIFLNLALDYLGEYSLASTQFEATSVGGISGITYDRQRDRIYALADDRQRPRFYTLALTLDQTDPDQPLINQITVEAVTFLQDPQGQPYPADQLDPEGIALTPQGTLFISSEGVAWTNSPPALLEFDLTGQWQQQLPLPKQYLAIPPTPEQPDPPPHGVDDNRGLESLAIGPEGDRIFTALEAPLVQDYAKPANQNTDSPDPPRQDFNRFLHYWVGEPQPLVIAEYLYPIDPTSLLGINGLTELLALDSSGHFLALERAYSPLTKLSANLFQIATASATDTSTLDRLPAQLKGILPIQKQPLLDFKTLKIEITNLEGMTWGPILADGRRSLLIVGDNNFSEGQSTQFLLFGLRQLRQKVS
ncbi:MAG: esterase-like activity of phytase family protein [Acaryochloridaceae cyanobacterium CSU_5_19]|nr:esterase-like activity of phytase family protein [Acaryochloridaceae cyanobacterium CSU_5_19]